jgi:hypothetical protein
MSRHERGLHNEKKGLKRAWRELKKARMERRSKRKRLMRAMRVEGLNNHRK